MNKIKIKWALIVMMGVIISSCTANKYNYSSSPVNMQVNLDVEDLEFIREVTGTANQSYFLGLPLGGKEKYKRFTVATYNSGQVFNLNNRGVNNALYDALSDVENVDFVLPLTTHIERNRMFLGRTDSVVVRLKAYRIK